MIANLGAYRAQLRGANTAALLLFVHCMKNGLRAIIVKLSSAYEDVSIDHGIV